MAQSYTARMAPPGPGDPGTWGTKHTPLLMSKLGWDRIHPFLQDRMRHVHLMTGFCVRNVYASPCEHVMPTSWGRECADPSCDRMASVYNESADEWVCGVHQCL